MSPRLHAPQGFGRIGPQIDEDDTRPGGAQQGQRPTAAQYRQGLGAEQVTTAECPAASSSDIFAAIRSIQGARSASFKGIPRRIFSTFSGGCRSSPSTMDQCNLAASAVANVDFPDPETPMTMRINTVLAHRRMVVKVGVEPTTSAL